MRLNYFNFKRFDNKVLLTNDLGNYLFVSPRNFERLIAKNIDLNSELGRELLDQNMVYDETNLEYSASRSFDMKRAKAHTTMASSLHIFVVTTACNMRCVYCQANNGVSSHPLYMTKEMAEKAVDVALQSPAYYLSFEFQGGEPLLNFEVVKHIVEYAEAHKGDHDIKYNLVSNLTLLTDDILDYLLEHRFGLSTSMDGSALVHDANRTYKDGSGTFEQVIMSVKKVRDRGMSVGAIQTTTKTSLAHPEEIVRTYEKLGFSSIFLRPLTPLGKASVNWDTIGYSPEDFIDFYKRAMKEVLRINQSGHFLKEDHAAIFLSRIAGQFVNYMELRSPCGASIGQMAYYADGDVFTCDEGRMLHEMGDHTFRLGNVFENSYNELIQSGVCRTVCASSILESIPSCCDCVYQPYCGTCPVVNYASEKDVIAKTPHGYRCRIYSGMLDYLFGLLKDKNSDIIAVLDTWSN